MSLSSESPFFHPWCRSPGWTSGAWSVGEFTDPPPVPAGQDRDRYLPIFTSTILLFASQLCAFLCGGWSRLRQHAATGPTTRGTSFLSFQLMVHANPFAIGTPESITCCRYWPFVAIMPTPEIDPSMCHRGALSFSNIWLYMVDIWLSVEMHRLEYYQFNRRSCALTCTIPPAVSCLDQDMATTGHALCFPLRSRRSYQYSMAIVRTLGKPGYFITSPPIQLGEIQAELLTGDQGIRCSQRATAPTCGSRF